MSLALITIHVNGAWSLIWYPPDASREALDLAAVRLRQDGTRETMVVEGERSAILQAITRRANA